MDKIFITTVEKDYRIVQNEKWLRLLGLLVIILYLPAVYHFTHHLSNWHIICALIAVPIIAKIGKQINKIWFEIMYECIPAKSFMIDKNGVTHQFIEDTWIKHYNYFQFTDEGKYPVISYAQCSCATEIQADIIVNSQPLTIRRFVYRLVLVREESIEKSIAVRKLIEQSNIDKYQKTIHSFEALGTYIAYEFGEKMATELSGLYNPVDEKQQEKFREILGRFLKDFCAGDSIRHGVGSKFSIYK